ncbi:MAG: redox-sensing transcriptional repressor Rex [Tissierellales bacterium]|jgi:redox-sensing transcriptional repressor|nr:redox-sensing transcriptional repressor Rex [Tissierellales bacterium]
MKEKYISMVVIRRLPKYYRYLSELEENGIKRISSKELSKLTGFTASQIRQDLNNFGGFGQQGYGYNVEDLKKELGEILGLNREYTGVIVGAGNMGQAIAKFRGFQNAGFRVQALFDMDEDLIGTEIEGIVVRSIDELEGFLEVNDIEIGVICTPKNGSQIIADKLVEGGVNGIWNFAPIDLKVPENIVVEDVHLNESLFTLSYLLKSNRDENEE